MLILLVAPWLALLVGPTAAGYVTVPLQSPAGVTYVNSQQHVGLLAGPVRYTSAAGSGAVAVTPAPVPTYYSYNVQPQAVFGKASYTPDPQYQYHHHHHHTAYGGPTVRVYEPRSFVYGVQPGSVPATHTVHTVPVSVSTTQYHHTPEPVTPAPHRPTVAVPVPVPVHVPVPVPVTPTYTKTVTTGPTYVQKPPVPPVPLVPVVRSRKFTVRRPAIQNQFYDIEERVIIRPVGSALVELEQPLAQTETQSKTTKTTQTTTTFVEQRPSVYVPPPPPPPPPPPSSTPPQVDVHGASDGAGYGTRIGGPRVVTQTTTVYTERPQVVVQKNTYDRVRVSAEEGGTQQRAHSAASTSKSSDAELIPAEQPRPVYTQGHAVYHPQQPAYVPHPFAAALAPHPFVYHPGNAGHLLHHVAFLDQHHSLVGHSGAPVYHPLVTPAVPTAGADCDRDGAKAPQYLPPPATATTPPPPVAEDEVEEYDDSIVVNARAGATDYEDSTASGYEQTVGSTAAPATTTSTTTTTHRNHDKYRGAEQSRPSIEVSYATRTTPASDIVAFDPSTASSGAFDLGPSPTSSTSPRPTTVALGGSTEQRSVTIVASSTPRTVSARFSESDRASVGASAAISSSSFSSSSSSSSDPSVVVGQGLTREQIHANQEQFIKLLSERDAIAEVGFGGGKAGAPSSSGSLIDAYVRSRVLSATPAPPDAKETSRTVNIRRIVVSRPVETEQEVEVREQGYATTAAPPAYEHKRDVSEVSAAAGDDAQQPPVYVNAKPPAFADGDQQQQQQQ